MSKVSLLKIPPSNHIPELHRDSLKWCFDPYRQKRAGWKNSKDGFITNYAEGGILGGGQIIFNGNCINGVLPNNLDGGLINSARGSLTVDSSFRYNNKPSMKYVGDGINAGGSYIRLGEWDVDFLGNGFYEIEIAAYIPSTSTRVTSMNLNARLADDSSHTILSLTDKDKWVKFHKIFYSGSNTSHPLVYFSIILDTYATPQTEVVYIADVKLRKIGNVQHGLCYGGIEDTGWSDSDVGIKFDGINDSIKYNSNIYDNSANNPVFVYWWQKGNSTGPLIDNDYNNFELYCDSTRFRGYVGLANSPGWKEVHVLPTTHGVSISNWNLFGVLIDFNADTMRYFVNGVVLIENDYSAYNLSVYDQTTKLGLGSRAGSSQFSSAALGISSIYWFTNGIVPSDIDTLMSDIWTRQRGIYGV